MAEQIVGFKIQINGQEKVVKSLGEMKQLLKEANFELLSAQQNFGEYSNEAINAAKKVATLKDNLQEAGETAQLFDPGKKFQAFAGALSAAAGGISAFQGALGLLGTESESVQKTLVKVQSALALSQGLSTIADSAKDFKRLGAVIQQSTIFTKAFQVATIAATAVQRAFGVSVTGTSVAFKALRGAILATGIGALVIGIGLLVEKIIDWTNRTSDAEKAQQKLAASTKKINGEIDNQISVLTALGGKEKEIYNLKVQQNDNELNLLRNKLKTTGKLNEEEMAQFRKLKTDKQILDIQEVNRIKKTQEEQAKNSSQTNQGANKQRIEDEKNVLKALEDLRVENIQIEFLRNQERINLDFQRRVDEINSLKINEQLKTQIIAEEQRKRDKLLEDNLKLIQQKEGDAAQIAKVNDVNKKAAQLDLEKSFQNALIEIQKASSDTKIKIEEQALQLRKNQLNETANAIQGLTTIVGKDTIAGKALGIATALINTYQGASEAIKQKSTLPSPFDVIAKVANVGAIIAMGLKTVKAITSVQVPAVKGGGNGASISTSTPPSISTTAPISPTQQLQASSTLLNAQAIQELGSATNRAYVVESDVTNSQERIKRINRAARLT
jgi:hypothetical protein